MIDLRDPKANRLARLEESGRDSFVFLCDSQTATALHDAGLIAVAVDDTACLDERHIVIVGDARLNGRSGQPATIRVLPGVDADDDPENIVAAAESAPVDESTPDDGPGAGAAADDDDDDEQPADDGDDDEPDSILHNRATDMGNARRFVQQNGRNVRYCFQWDRWLTWDGKRWLVDETGRVMRMAKQTVRNIYREAASTSDDAIRQAIIEHAKRSESVQRLKAMLELAKSEPGVPIQAIQLDADPMLLNTPGGTIELKTGKVRQHRREDLLTKITRARYNPDAPRPVFDAFMARIFRSYPELIDYVQKVCGYCATGLTVEQALFFAYGKGGNGKTRFVEAITYALGDYCDKADPDLLTASNNTVHPTNVADLMGLRIAICSETNEGRRFDEAKLKDLVGETQLKARFMRQDFFSFQASHKIILYSNHKPVVRGTDYGFWRRIRLIPFVETIGDDEKDSHLAEKLQGESDAILAWVVQGCMAWQRDGLGLPDAVAQATDGYRQEMDTIGSFLNECCTFFASATANASDLYQAYKRWCEDAGERPLSQKRLGSQLGERGLEKARDSATGRIAWRGIGLTLNPDNTLETRFPEPSE